MYQQLAIQKWEIFEITSLMCLDQSRIKTHSKQGEEYDGVVKLANHTHI
jgi:hypothetical protein